jgi:hypothetical protein
MPARLGTRASSRAPLLVPFVCGFEPDLTMRRLQIILIGVVAALLLLVAKFRDVNPTARAGRAALADLSRQAVISIRLEPARSRSVIRAPIDITDTAEVAEFVRWMSPLKEFQPNHPNPSRYVVVTFKLRDRVISGELAGGQTSALFYYYSDTDQGWVYGTYLVPNAAPLFALIERLAQPAP